MFATIDKALSQYGVHTDGVGTTDFVGVGLTRALPDHVGEAIQLSVEDTYQRFVGLVGKGRGLSPEEAEKAAEGRVWTGQDAKALGLVDEFGNLDDALKAAADLANLKSWQVTPIAPEESARDKFLRELFDSSAQALAPHLQSWLPAGLGKALLEMNRTLDPLTRFNDPQGTYAFCPVCLP
jgi:protease-4